MCIRKRCGTSVVRRTVRAGGPPRVATNPISPEGLARLTRVGVSTGAVSRLAPLRCRVDCLLHWCHTYCAESLVSPDDDASSTRRRSPLVTLSLAERPPFQRKTASQQQQRTRGPHRTEKRSPKRAVGCGAPGMMARGSHDGRQPLMATPKKKGLFRRLRTALSISKAARVAPAIDRSSPARHSRRRRHRRRAPSHELRWRGRRRSQEVGAAPRPSNKKEGDGRRGRRRRRKAAELADAHFGRSLSEATDDLVTVSPDRETQLPSEALRVPDLHLRKARHTEAGTHVAAATLLGASDESDGSRFGAHAIGARQLDLFDSRRLTRGRGAFIRSFRGLRGA